MVLNYVQYFLGKYSTLQKYGIFVSVPTTVFQCFFGLFSPKDFFFTVAVTKVKTFMLNWNNWYSAVMVTAEYQLFLPI